ncbi:hypothetical protein BC941DRAFT_457960 [Chlamydoabsidia padenii]|nr:hypothetical protein BC941DRAFT_457960 [Chlamydoabsidia padenii]
MFGGIEEYGEVEEKEKLTIKKRSLTFEILNIITEKLLFAKVGQNKIIVLSDTETDDLDYEALKNDDSKIYDMIRPNIPIIPSSLAKICDEMGKALANQNNSCYIDCVVELIDRVIMLTIMPPGDNHLLYGINQLAKHLNEYSKKVNLPKLWKLQERMFGKVANL